MVEGPDSIRELFLLSPVSPPLLSSLPFLHLLSLPSVEAATQADLYVVKDDFELLMLLFLPLSPKCWHSGHMPPGLVHAVLGVELKALCMEGEHSTD